MDVVYKDTIPQNERIPHMISFIANTFGLDTENLKDMEGDQNSPCGIVYCRKRSTVESIAYHLTCMGVKSFPYSGKMTRKERESTQKGWMEGKFSIIVATNAFGMGIDKATVRAVIHWDFPQSPAA